MAFSISPRLKVLGAMGIVVTAAVGVTLAAFTDSGKVETTFSSGTLDLKFDADEDGNPTNYQIDFSDGFDSLLPGSTVSRDLLVYNSGTIDADLSLTAPEITNAVVAPASVLEDNMTITITDTTVPASPVSLYTGPLTAAAFSGLDISSGGAANGRTLHLEVTLLPTADVSISGQTIQTVLPFVATQS